MIQSYIPAGTDVICTEMTGGEPAQLGLTREANPSLTGKNIFHKYSGCFV